MASAGLTQGIGASLGVNMDLSSFDSIGQHAAYQGLQGTVGLALDALTGENITDALQNRLKFAAVNTIAGFAANKIGEAYNKTPEGMKNPSRLSWGEHKLLHGGLGAAMGAALSRNAGEGALAASIASMVAESLAEEWAPKVPTSFASEDEKDSFKKNFYARYKHAADMAKLFTATLAMLYCPKHIDVAVLAATNALENNFLVGAVRALIALSIAAYAGLTASEITKAYEKGGWEEALKVCEIEAHAIMVYENAVSGLPPVSVVGAAAVGGAQRVAYKVGGRIFETAETAHAFIVKTYPKLASFSKDEFFGFMQRQTVKSEIPAMVRGASHTTHMPTRTAPKAPEGVSGVGGVKGLTFQGGRHSDGIAHSSSVLADSPNLLRGTQGNAGNVPLEIARNLEGKSFQSFDQFRLEFWKTVANSKYASEFGKTDLLRMSKGRAPVAFESQQLGSRMSYELHHKTPICQGGSTYDLSNIMIVTPRFHVESLANKFHRGTQK